MSELSESDEAVFLTAMAAFDCVEDPDLYEHTHEETAVVDVVEVTDRPRPGVNSYTTLGLSNHQLAESEDRYPLRVELVGACAGDVHYYDLVLADIALNIRDAHCSPRPGEILLDAIGHHDPDVTTTHVLLMPPFAWEDGPHTMYLHDRTVVFLFVLPISDGERAYAAEHGVAALGELLDEHDVDVFDLNRASVA